MTFHIITIFPNIFNSYFNESILKRAQNKSLINIKIHNLRDWADDKHKKVDDTPYGGGAGMVMKADIIYKAISDIKEKIEAEKLSNKTISKLEINKLIRNSKFEIRNCRTILFSAKGKTWNQALAKKYSKLENVIMICGRYEGIDERVKKFVDEEISIGDYVLTGGEIPAMAVVDSISRLIPEVLGNKESLNEESFSLIRNSLSSEASTQGEKFKISARGGSALGGQNSSLEYPQYTRPEVLEIKGKKLRVPKVLLSGNHKNIEDWRKKQSKIKKIKL